MDADMILADSHCDGCYITHSPKHCRHKPEEADKVESDGGSSSYYNLPEGATELNDLIEQKGMSFARGNIFKACFRLGGKANVDALYDINKIIFFAERMKLMLEKGTPL
jgi:hypothetical protein